jgi:hypothetical protein
MTKVIILGEQPEEKGLKPIEFKKYLDNDLTSYIPSTSPSDFENIELICKNYRGENIDLLFVYNDDRRKGLLYLGHFNDGVV